MCRVQRRMILDRHLHKDPEAAVGVRVELKCAFIQIESISLAIGFFFFTSWRKADYLYMTRATGLDHS